MSLSVISQVLSDTPALAHASFVRMGLLYAAWVSAANSNLRKLSWRVHDGTTGTEVVTALSATFNRVSVIPRTDGHLIVVYDDSDAQVPSLYAATFDFLTGAVIVAPSKIANGSSPSVVRLVGATPGRFTLAYSNRRLGSIYLRESFNDGVTWGDERPVLNNKVRDTADAYAVEFGPKHLSIVQIGEGGKRLIELGSYSRTRPVVDLVSTGPNRLVAVEATVRGGSFVDNLRGGIVFDTGVVYASTRQRLGTNDGVSEVMLLDTTASAPALLSSAATTPGAAAGAEVARLDLGVGLVLRDVTAAPVAGGGLAQIAVAEGHLFGAVYREDVTDGGLVAMRLSDRVTSITSSGVHFHAVTAQRGPGAVSADTVIISCRMIGMQNYLSVGKLGANPLAPAWLLGDHALPARADALTLALTGPDTGTIYAALHDRLCVYRLAGLTQPIRLVNTILSLTLGRVMQMKLAPNGNLVCAMGEGGVAIFSPDGETVAQFVPSGITASFWYPATAYVLGGFALPTPDSLYFGQRKRFRCTTAGSSGSVEPAWAPSGTVVDGAARWTEDSPTIPVVTSVVVDGPARRIYAAAVLGGALGTSGRVYTISAQGLI